MMTLNGDIFDDRCFRRQGRLWAAKKLRKYLDNITQGMGVILPERKRPHKQNFFGKMNGAIQMKMTRHSEHNILAIQSQPVDEHCRGKAWHEQRVVRQIAAHYAGMNASLIAQSKAL